MNADERPVIHRHSVAIDDAAHILPVHKAAEVVMVGVGPNTPDNSVDVWVRTYPAWANDPEDFGALFAVVGTGQPWPFLATFQHVGSVIDPRMPLVWHVLRAVQS